MNQKGNQSPKSDTFEIVVNENDIIDLQY